MKLSTEAKVGAVTLIGLIMLGYIIIHLGSFSFGEKGYPVKAVFSQVGGLKTGNAVRYAGVDVGRIESIDVSPQGVIVTMMIDKGVKIPQGAKLVISTDGLIGEKFIDITPPEKTLKYIEPGDTMRGEDPKGFDTLMATAEAVITKFDKLVGTLNDIFTDDVKISLKAALLNAKAITENINVLTETMARMAVNNEAEIKGMVHNLYSMSVSLRNITARVDTMAANFDNEGQTIKDLRDTIANIKSSSARIENMTKALEGVVADPKTAQDIRETLQNAREASSKANKLLAKINNVSADTSFEVLHRTKELEGKNYRTSADVKINTSGDEFALIGVSGIGDDNNLNLQLGKTTGTLSRRLGLMESKPGIGVDGTVKDQLRISIDAYNPNDVRLKLRGELKLSPDTFLVGQTDNINKDTEKSSYVGVKHSF